MTPILNHYFARINWLGAAAANIDTLRALHLKHNCTIPFENLDVLLPREIQLCKFTEILQLPPDK